jgi:hypothetical protein
MVTKEPASFTAGCILTPAQLSHWRTAMQGEFAPLAESNVSPLIRSQFPAAEFFVGKIPYREADRTFVLAFDGEALLIAMGSPHSANTDSKRDKMSAAVRNVFGFAPADYPLTEPQDDQLDGRDKLSFAISKYVRGDSLQI